MPAICSNTLRELADLWCRMDAHEGQAAWAQAIGGLIGLAVAIAVPAYLEVTRRAGERQALIEKRRAAFRVMRSVIEALRLRPQVGPDEIEAIGSVLDRIDIGMLPERPAVVLVHLRARIATAAASAGKELIDQLKTTYDNGFDVIGATEELEAVKLDLGMKPGE